MRGVNERTVSETKKKDQACERAALLSECSLELHSKVSRPSSICVLPFSEKTRNCVKKKKKTTFELREEKGPYLFFGKELAVFKSHPRHYFKDHRWAFLCRRIQKSQSASFFFFFYPIPKVIMHSAITAFLRFLQ